MSGKKISIYAGVLAGLLLISLMFGCSGLKSGKIPVTTSSNKARQYYLQGLELSDKLRATSALQYFEKAIQEDPDFALAYLNRAFVYPGTAGFFDNLNRAAALMDKVSEGERLWIMATIAGTNADPAKQLRYLKRLTEIHPRDERALNLLATYYFAQQDYNQAVELYQQAIAINPLFSQPYNQLGYSYRFLGNFSESEKAFQKYIELIPDDPNPYDSYAELLMQMGRFDESINYYNKALATDSQFAASYLGIASNLVFKGEHEAARSELQKLYDKAANNNQRRTALYGMALTYLDQRNFNLAVEHIDRECAIAEADQDTPSLAGELGGLGLIYLEYDRPDEALRRIDRAQELVKQSSLSDEIKQNYERGYIYSLARVALKKGDLATAKAKSQEYMARIQPLNNASTLRSAHQLAGLVALAEKDFDTAIKEFSQANQLNPDTFYRLGLAYQGLGDSVKAREMMKKVANFNQVFNLNYALVRPRALEMLKKM